eukprot:1019525-Pleurochrysis_carterae.AAC.1
MSEKAGRVKDASEPRALRTLLAHMGLEKYAKKAATLGYTAESLLQLAGRGELQAVSEQLKLPKKAGDRLSSHLGRLARGPVWCWWSDDGWFELYGETESEGLEAAHVSGNVPCVNVRGIDYELVPGKGEKWIQRQRSDHKRWRAADRWEVTFDAMDTETAGKAGSSRSPAAAPAVSAATTGATAKTKKGTRGRAAGGDSTTDSASQRAATQEDGPQAKKRRKAAAAPQAQRGGRASAATELPATQLMDESDGDGDGDGGGAGRMDPFSFASLRARAPAEVGDDQLRELLRHSDVECVSALPLMEAALAEQEEASEAHAQLGFIVRVTRER